MKKKIFVVDHGTYPFDVMVCISATDEEVIAELKKVGTLPDKEELEAMQITGAGRTCMLNGGQTVLRLEKNDPADLAHEIFHAVEFLFDRIGLKYSLETGEAWAYQIQYLTERIYEKMKKVV